MNEIIRKAKLAVVFCLVFAMSFIVFSSSSQAAEKFPDKPVTMIVAYSPGGGTDLAARTIGKYMEKYLGQPVVVENRSGAGGQIGFTALSKATPDGYTIGMLNVPALNMLAAVRENITYKPSDFVPLANAILDPVVLAVGEKSEFKDMKSFIEYAKKHPGEIILGVDGPQTNAQLQALIMEKALGLKLKYVFYNGAAPALTATIGNHVVGTTPGASEAQTYVQNGQLRVLTVFSEKRFPGLPDVPTYKEVTGKMISYVPSNRGIGTQSAVPAERKKILEDALKKAIADPEFQQKAKEIGLPIYYQDSKSFQKTIAVLENELVNFKDMLMAK